VAPGEQPPADSQATAAPAARATSTPPAAVPRSQTAPAVASEGSRSPQISPKARRLAKEKGVDITKIVGTGPDGTISSEDVLKAAADMPAAAEAPASGLSAIARLMAERTTQSWTQVPHFFLVREVDARGLIELREKLGITVVTHTDLLVAITARVLVKHPEMNAPWA